jgi:alpha-glucosidase
VDGFRMDVLWHLIKDAHLRDNPANPEYRASDIPYNSLIPAYSTDQPEVHGIVREMRALLDESPGRLMIGEIYLPLHKLVSYYGSDGDGAHLPFNFMLVTLPWQAQQIAAAVSEYEGALPPNAWPNWVLGNHDQPRIASRVGREQARVAAVLLLTLRGTPTLYYGDELGLADVPIALDELQDPQGKNVGLSRDPQRTPMQWSSAPGAGFSRGRPWLPLSSDYELVNVATQREDPESTLNLYRRLLALRRTSRALSLGSYVPLPSTSSLFVYLREHGAERMLIALNFTSQPAELTLDGAGEITRATSLEREGERVAGRLWLAGNQALVIVLDS